MRTVQRLFVTLLCALITTPAPGVAVSERQLSEPNGVALGEAQLSESKGVALSEAQLSESKGESKSDSKVVFVVRHAERADTASGPPMMGSDPPLSDVGRKRAESLAAMLKDAGITAIYVTEFKRTQETAAPLAASLGITPVSIPAKDIAKLAATLGASAGNVLVVGHSNTIPDIVKALGIRAALTIEDGEFDNLLVVTPGPQPTLVRLRYH